MEIKFQYKDLILTVNCKKDWGERFSLIAVEEALKLPPFPQYLQQYPHYCICGEIHEGDYNLCEAYVAMPRIEGEISMRVLSYFSSRVVGETSFEEGLKIFREDPKDRNFLLEFSTEHEIYQAIIANLIYLIKIKDNKIKSRNRIIKRLRK